MLDYSFFKFVELSTHLLYEILAIRQEVFIVEQNCPYQDADGIDFSAYHLLGCKGDILLSYARLVPPDIAYENFASIGRVITASSIRKTGEGYRLMDESITRSKSLWPDTPIKISAQSHLQQFYSKCGFSAVGNEYLEDDIPHISMILDI